MLVNTGQPERRRDARMHRFLQTAVFSGRMLSVLDAYRPKELWAKTSAPAGGPSLSPFLGVEWPVVQVWAAVIAASRGRPKWMLLTHTMPWECLGSWREVHVSFGRGNRRMDGPGRAGTAEEEE